MMVDAAGGLRPASGLVTERSVHSAISSAGSTSALKSWFGVSPEELRFMVDSAAWGTCAIMAVMYTESATTVLSAFVCRTFHSSLFVLVEDPDVTCWSSLHASIWGFALSMIPVHVALVPGAFSFVLFVGWKRKQLDHPHFMARWGFIMERFERKYFWLAPRHCGPPDAL